jgi:hypothetical protein
MVGNAVAVSRGAALALFAVRNPIANRHFRVAPVRLGG